MLNLSVESHNEIVAKTVSWADSRLSGLDSEGGSVPAFEGLEHRFELIHEIADGRFIAREKASSEKVMVLLKSDRVSSGWMNSRVAAQNDNLLHAREVWGYHDGSLLVCDLPAEGDSLEALVLRDAHFLVAGDCIALIALLRALREAVESLAKEDICPNHVELEEIVIGRDGAPQFLGLIPEANTDSFPSWQALGELLLNTIGNELDSTSSPIQRDLYQVLRIMSEGNTLPFSEIYEALPDLAGPPVTFHERTFVGREKELSSLGTMLQRSESGYPTVTLVSGESGIGKSALIQRFVETADDQVMVFSSRCYPESVRPYNAFSELMDNVTKWLSTHPQARYFLPRNFDALKSTFPSFSRVTPGDMAGDQPSLDPARQKRLTLGAVRELFGRIVDSQPVIICMDDMQWSDAESVALLQLMFDGYEAPNIMWILSFRGALPEAFSEVEGSEDLLIEHLPLKPLSDRELRAMALKMGGGSLQLDELEELLINAEGSPFVLGLCLEQVLAGSDDDRALVSSQLRQFIEQLDERERHIIDLAALVASPLESDLASQILGFDVNDSLDRLVQRRYLSVVVATPRPVVMIYHDKLREAVLAGMHQGYRRGLHLSFAEAMESSGSTDFYALYLHYSHAAQFSKAFDYLIRAAQQASDKYAFGLAVDLYRKALHLRSDQCERVYPLLAKALADSGEPIKAAEQYIVASSMFFEQVDRINHLAEAADHYLTGGHVEEGIRVYLPVLKFHGITFPGTQQRSRRWFYRLVGLLRAQGLSFRERSESEISEYELQRIDICDAVARGLQYVDNLRGIFFSTYSLLLALRCGESRRVFRALDMLQGTGVLVMAGREVANIGDRLLQGERQNAEARHDMAFLGRFDINEAQKTLALGDWALTIELTERGLGKLEQTGEQHLFESNSGTMALLRALEEVGDYSLLLERADELVEAAQRRGDFYGIATGKLYGASVHLARDNVELARIRSDEVESMWSARDFHLQHFYIKKMQATCDLYDGLIDSAASQLEAIHEPLQASGLMQVPMVIIDHAILNLRIGLCRCLKENRLPGKDEQALVDTLLTQKRRDALALGNVFHAAIASIQGDDAAVIDLLESARDNFTASQMTLWTAYVELFLGQLYGGDEGAALQRKANTQMFSLGISNVNKWLELQVPGLLSQGQARRD